MYTEKDIIIPLDNKKNVIVVLGAMLFVAMGFFFLLDPGLRESHHPIFLLIIGYMAILFFGLCLIFGIKKLFDKNPGLVINADGVFDNSSAISVGLIPWRRITFIKTMEILSSKTILIGVENAEEILRKQGGFKRFWLNMNYKATKTPVSINPMALRIKFDDLEKMLMEKWALHKGKSADTSIDESKRQNVDTDYKLYTTGWMVASTYIGGPLAGFYLLRTNYKNLKKNKLAKKALIQGVFISFVLFTSLVVLPQKIVEIIPNAIFPIIYCILLGVYADFTQGSEIKDHIKNGGKRYAGWKAVGIGIICLIATLLYIFALSYIITAIRQ